MKLLFYFTLIFTLFTASLSAQKFEGEIDFVKTTYRDTIHYKYYVKNNLVRLDELSTNGDVLGTLLFDLEKQTIYAVNHLRKLYIDYKPTKTTKNYSLSVVRKTLDTKKINGFKCVKWSVNNTQFDTKAVYWVTEGKYDFFAPLMRLWNEKSRLSQYYLQIPATNGYLPVLAEEYYKNGKLKSTLKTISVTKKKLDDTLFQIPDDYVKFDS